MAVDIAVMCVVVVAAVVNYFTHCSYIITVAVVAIVSVVIALCCSFSVFLHVVYLLFFHTWLIYYCFFT